MAMSEYNSSGSGTFFASWIIKIASAVKKIIIFGAGVRVFPTVDVFVPCLSLIDVGIGTGTVLELIVNN
jgi:hypothetical protein